MHYECLSCPSFRVEVGGLALRSIVRPCSDRATLHHLCNRPRRKTNTGSSCRRKLPSGPCSTRSRQMGRHLLLKLYSLSYHQSPLLANASLMQRANGKGVLLPQYRMPGLTTIPQLAKTPTSTATGYRNCVSRIGAF